ncbi:MAG: glycosyltransferase family 2 protein [Candidatus Nanohaloarchaea archaeon]|nr:glycosyltransferase family 2 protein [Candidatus Nanohaloarchaea archaeon]
MDISIVIPTYNEFPNIEDLIGLVEDAIDGEDYEIIVVDGGSTDGTAATLEKLTAQNDRVRAILNDTRHGIGAAYQKGFAAAEGDIIVQMDADFSHPPEHIMDLVASVRDGNDIAVGSRYVDGGDRQDPLHRRIFPYLGSYLYRVLLQSPVKDVTSGFKAYSREAANTIVNASLPDRFHFQAASLFTVLNAGNTATEVPITFRRRRAGSPKYTTRDLIDNLWLLGRLAIEKNQKILKFGTVGGLGVFVNMGILYALTDIMGVFYLFSATAAAESAMLFNFAFHDRWTFPDTGDEGMRNLLQRLYQYHVVSAAGGAVNLAVLWALTDIFAVYYLISNLVAIGAAFFINYGANIRWTWDST